MSAATPTTRVPRAARCHEAECAVRARAPRQTGSFGRFVEHDRRLAVRSAPANVRPSTSGMRKVSKYSRRHLADADRGMVHARHPAAGLRLACSRPPRVAPSGAGASLKAAETAPGVARARASSSSKNAARCAGVGYLVRAESGGQRDDALGVEAERHVDDVPQASQQQRGAAEQRQRQRDLRGDQREPDARPRARRRGARRPQPLHPAGAKDGDRRPQADRDPGDDDQQGGHDEHADVDRRLRDARNARAGAIATNVLRSANASRSPTPPAASASSRLSASARRARRSLPAPTAARTANSRWRSATRASMRLVTFTHAISRKTPRRR